MNVMVWVPLGPLVQRVLAQGPERVMVDEWSAVNPRLAKLNGVTRIDVIFIRDDGWSLGAPARLEEAARRTWPDRWVAVLRGTECQLLGEGVDNGKS